MNEQFEQNIRYLMASVFDDNEFNTALDYFRTGQYNALRAYVSQKYDEMDALPTDDNNFLQQKYLCDRLEDALIDIILGEKL